jgi:hypothetical protein
MAQKNNYQLLVEKLDQFIRKFYVNKLIRGGLYSLGLILLLFVSMNVLEYYYYFNSGIRKLLFFSFIGVSVAALSYWVFWPLAQYFRLGSIISREQAATIIGQHFTDVKDKLLNILQLKDQADQVSNRDLILASINQKSEEIKIVPFKKAIDLSQNRKYLKYALPPLLLLLIILFAAPSIIKDGTNRLINNSKEFERPAPFAFNVEKEDLSVVQFEDYLLEVTVEGEAIPNEVFIDIDDYQYRLTKDKGQANLFTHRFSNVQKAVDFKLYSSGVTSEDYKLSVLKKPNILGFDVEVDYPAYTKRKDEKLESIGDLVVPLGTNLDWIFNAENTNDISIRFSGEETTSIKRFADDLFSFEKRALKDQSYMLYISNENLPNADSVSYSISVIPDLYPDIKAEKFQDSTDAKLLFFVGEGSDDYGLKSLSFNYRIKRDGKQGELNTEYLPTGKGNQVQYDYTFDMAELALKPGDEVLYYFEVYDNDGVNGSKAARTNLMMYNMPTVEEFEAMEEQNEDEIKEDLKKAMEESKKIQEEMKKMREKLLQEKEVDWQTKKELEKLLERQEALENQIEDAKEKFEENLKNQEEFSEKDEQILEKQERLQEMFEEMMSEEMQELMKQIEEMLQELEKDDALEMMEDMEMNDEELEMELDRMLEMFKQLELEQEMNDMIDKLEELAEEQEKLAEETEQQENSNAPEDQKEEKQEELEKKQEELNEEMEKLEEKWDEIEKKNEELEQPQQIGDKDEQMEDIKKDMQKSSQQMQQKQNGKASKSQKDAASKMKDMAAAMQMQMQQQEMEQMEEDMKALRQLLENLVGLSFDQEDLIDEFTQTSINTPRYVELVQRQFKLKDDFKLVEDSLQALSKRVIQIESYVTEKVTEVKGNFREGLKELEERKKPQASEHQRRAMKNTNDLALMLSEVMNQMQQQMSSMMSGAQMCNNPGNKSGQNGKVPQDKMGQGQQGLNQQMQQMKKNLENGKGGSSKEFAKMAAKQAALRNALREKQKKLQEQGKGRQELQDLIEQMDKTETDLVNKKLTNEMMKRQEEILTRLLKHEKAEREREFDQKRKAEAASKKERKMPPSLEEYIKKREAEVEMYKAVSPSLKPYYKFLVEEYLKTLKDTK